MDRVIVPTSGAITSPILNVYAGLNSGFLHKSGGACLNLLGVHLTINCLNINRIYLRIVRYTQEVEVRIGQVNLIVEEPDLSLIHI